MTKIEKMTEAAIPEIAPLVALFRVTLKAFKGITAFPNDNEGASELREYLDAGFPVFTARKDGVYCGYMVCRVDEPLCVGGVDLCSAGVPQTGCRCRPVLQGRRACRVLRRGHRVQLCASQQRWDHRVSEIKRIYRAESDRAPQALRR